MEKQIKAIEQTSRKAKFNVDKVIDDTVFLRAVDKYERDMKSVLEKGNAFVLINVYQIELRRAIKLN